MQFNKRQCGYLMS